MDSPCLARKVVLLDIKARLHAYIRPVVSSVARALMTFARGLLISLTVSDNRILCQVEPTPVLPISIQLTYHAICWWDHLRLPFTRLHFTRCSSVAGVLRGQLIGFASGQHRPQNTGMLGCQGNGGNVRATPPLDGLRPAADPILAPGSQPQHRTSALDE